MLEKPQRINREWISQKIGTSAGNITILLGHLVENGILKRMGYGKFERLGSKFALSGQARVLIFDKVELQPNGRYDLCDLTLIEYQEVLFEGSEKPAKPIDTPAASSSPVLVAASPEVPIPPTDLPPLNPLPSAAPSEIDPKVLDAAIMDRLVHERVLAKEELAQAQIQKSTADLNLTNAEQRLLGIDVAISVFSKSPG
jgi:hypothetical protein